MKIETGQSPIININRIEKDERPAPERSPIEDNIRQIKRRLHGEQLPYLKAAQDKIWKARLGELIDWRKAEEMTEQVDQASIDLIGIKCRYIPEYYFDLDQEMANNQAVHDWIFGQDSKDLDSQLIEEGRPRFIPQEAYDYVKSRGYTDLLIMPSQYDDRSVFLSYFKKAFEKEFGHSTFVRQQNTENDFAEASGARHRRGDWTVIMTKPNLEIPEDEEFAQTMNWTPKQMYEFKLAQQDESHKVEAFKKNCSHTAFNLEEYLYWQMYLYLKSGRDVNAMADAETWHIFCDEKFFANQKYLGLKWLKDEQKFLISNWAADEPTENAGMRLIYHT